MELMTMATDALPAAFARDPDLTAVAARARVAKPACASRSRKKPTLLRRLYLAIVEAQTRLAEREIARLLRTHNLSLTPDAERRPAR
jgi:hypothetical protein